MLACGSAVKLRHERFHCAEVLFKPSMHKKDYVGVHELAFNSVKACDVDIRSELCEGICPVGGCSGIPGFERRLCSELKKLIDGKHVVCALQQPDHQTLTWIGAKAFLQGTQDQWCLAEEYQSRGEEAISLKC